MVKTPGEPARGTVTKTTGAKNYSVKLQPRGPKPTRQRPTRAARGAGRGEENRSRPLTDSGDRRRLGHRDHLCSCFALASLSRIARDRRATRSRLRGSVRFGWVSRADPLPAFLRPSNDTPSGAAKFGGRTARLIPAPGRSVPTATRPRQAFLCGLSRFSLSTICLELACGWAAKRRSPRPPRFLAWNRAGEENRPIFTPPAVDAGIRCDDNPLSTFGKGFPACASPPPTPCSLGKSSPTAPI